MAELHVQRKRNNFLWLWLIIVALIIAAVAYWYLNYYQQNGVTTTTNSADTLNSEQRKTSIDTTGSKSN